jgi:hypothetical protein
LHRTADFQLVRPPHTAHRDIDEVERDQANERAAVVTVLGWRASWRLIYLQSCKTSDGGDGVA